MNIMRTLRGKKVSPSQFRPYVQRNRHRIKRKRNKNKIHFYKSYSGLSYEGKCSNIDCRAYLKPVTVKRGYGEKIEPIKDAEDGFMKCPGCSKIFELRTIKLRRCKGKIEYQLLNDEEITTKQVSVKRSDSLYFGEIVKKGSDKININESNTKRKRKRKKENLTNRARCVAIDYKILQFNVKRHKKYNRLKRTYGRK